MKDFSDVYVTEDSTSTKISIGFSATGGELTDLKIVVDELRQPSLAGKVILKNAMLTLINEYLPMEK